jgi:hypothetical protein
VARRGQYRGASNSAGKVPIISGYATVYWDLNGSIVSGNYNDGWSNLAPGYWTTKEVYGWANGSVASYWNGYCAF